MALDFIKAHYLGNDYIYIDLILPESHDTFLSFFDQLPDAIQQQQQQQSQDNLVVDAELRVPVAALWRFVRCVSDRRSGIGADGVIFLVAPAAAAAATAPAKENNSDEEHEPEPTQQQNGGDDYDAEEEEADALHSNARAKMRMFNADGSESPMCGNGLMTLAAIAVAHGHAEESQFGIITGAGKLATAAVSSSTDHSSSSSSRKQYVVRLAVATPIFDFHAVPCNAAAGEIPEFFEDQLEDALMLHAESPLPVMFELPVATDLLRPLKALSSSLSSSSSSSPSRRRSSSGFSLLVNNRLSSAVAQNKIVIAAIGMGNPHAVVLFPAMSNGDVSDDVIVSNPSVEDCVAAAIPLAAALAARISSVNSQEEEEEEEAQQQQQQSPTTDCVAATIPMVAALAARISEMESDRQSRRGKEEPESSHCRAMVDAFPLQHFAEEIVGKSNLFPQGVNVSVGTVSGVSKRREQQQQEEEEEEEEEDEEIFDLSISMRTWERGSGATLACGSGACATVVAAAHLLLNHGSGGDASGQSSDSESSLFSEPVAVPCRTVVATVHQPGGRAVISYSVDVNGTSRSCVMQGTPRIVFRGTLDAANVC